MTKNKKRYFTIMIIPHTEENVFSIRIPMYLFQLTGIFLVAALIISFVWFRSSQKLQEEVADIRRLREEKRILNEQIDLMTRETEELIHYIDRIEALAWEIRKLMNHAPKEPEVVKDNIWDGYLVRERGDYLLASRGDNRVIGRNEANIAYLQEVLPQKADELASLKSDVQEYQKRLAATPSIWPTRGRVTSEFGTRLSPFTRRREFHYGIDIAAPRGTPVYATAEGEVILAAYRRGMGNTIIIDHGYNFRTLYGHLSGFAVAIGDWVKKGQFIGYIGSSGLSTGSHLHYEVHVKGVAVNPREFLP